MITKHWCRHSPFFIPNLWPWKAPDSELTVWAHQLPQRHRLLPPLPALSNQWHIWCTHLPLLYIGPCFNFEYGPTLFWSPSISAIQVQSVLCSKARILAGHKHKTTKVVIRQIFCMDSLSSTLSFLHFADGYTLLEWAAAVYLFKQLHPLGSFTGGPCLCSTIQKGLLHVPWPQTSASIPQQHDFWNDSDLNIHSLINNDSNKLSKMPENLLISCSK